MIPSRKWFPQSLQERAAWYENFKKQFVDDGIGATLGFTPAELTSVTNDNAIIQFLASTQTQLDAFADAVRHYRIIITESGIGDPTPAFPANPAFALPAPAVATGIFERLDDNVKRSRVAPAYTAEAGALLGIIASPNVPIAPGALKPVIKVGESVMGYKFTVNVTRLGQEAFKIQIQRKGQNDWTDAAFATNNPVEVTITPTTPGNPERILVRAILLEKNAPVGQPSDPAFITANP